MDAAPPLRPLEANCSLALAEELLPDGWAPPAGPEGRRGASGPGGAGSFAGALVRPGPRAPSAPHPARPARPATPLSPAPLPSLAARSLLLLQHDLGRDRDVLAPERGRSPGGEAVPRVL